MDNHKPIIEYGSHDRNRLKSIFMIILFLLAVVGILVYISDFGDLFYSDHARAYCEISEAQWDANKQQILPTILCIGPWPYQPIVLCVLFLSAVWLLWKPMWQMVRRHPRFKVSEEGFEALAFKPAFFSALQPVFVRWHEVDSFVFEKRLFFIFVIMISAHIELPSGEYKKVQFSFGGSQATDPAIAAFLQKLFEKFPDYEPREGDELYDIIYKK